MINAKHIRVKEAKARRDLCMEHETVGEWSDFPAISEGVVDNRQTTCRWICANALCSVVRLDSDRSVELGPAIAA